MSKRVQAELSFGERGEGRNNGDDTPFSAVVWLPELQPHVDVISPLDSTKRWRFNLTWHAETEADGSELAYWPAFYQFAEEV